MRRPSVPTIVSAVAAMLAAYAPAAAPARAAERPQWAMVMHGGAGVIERAHMTPAVEAAYRASLARALKAGTDRLAAGGPALDAVEAAIRVLEDDPLFNAGKGAVFTAQGRNELDAAIQDGASLKAGAVAGVTRTRHPISLARAVMEKSPHVMLAGAGADAFSARAGLEQEPPAYFFTERSWSALVRDLQARGSPVPPRPQGAPPPPSAPVAALPTGAHKYGTVGVVALDRAGHVAAGTSTGGITGKQWGRVGDSPIIGAGTYASDASCAVSGTGQGEFFIRMTVAREICALVQYRHEPLQAAADEVIQKRLTAAGGEGGVVAIAPDGQLAWSFNTPGMYRARQVAGGAPQVSIFKDEP